jgi:Nif-specific regulatory protein
LNFIAKAGPSDSTVLILGESGTGKELVARALHDQSPRSKNPFIAINCASLAEPLLESELFGHERGAFTGAIAQKKGKLEIAEGGTLFLDEVAELTPVLQAKLLRVIQERQFERVGGTHPIRVNIRILAATNKNLKDQIKTGSFREDLYYRIHVLTVALPALRDRPTDIPLLASFFASRFAAKIGRPVTGISPQARKLLLRYEWPGNVRELENAIEHAVVLGSSPSILVEDLPESLIESKTTADLSKYHAAVQETKKQLILKAIENSGGHFTEAAKLLGIHPNYLHRLIRNLGLRELIKNS